ncbi:hypothetical protein ACZ87_00945 [Candidatus Erwinia dacicola]|uniref:Uncharacterized protein n=1 Tax=Candidatus Erwinia dacicola TaxID=252393 RepID=A0A328TS28_9GAMM|nr:hypothetical protein ACZ87_00945 [Candidatus Erwinia dacicola]
MAVNKELAVTRRNQETLRDTERKLSARRLPDADDSTPADIKSEDDANP